MSQTAVIPHASMGRRLLAYLMERFPLHINVPVAFFGFYGYYFLVQLLHGATTLAVTPASLAGAVTLTAFGMLLRIFDEFKDLANDARFFPDRPVPAGRVLLGDLKLLGWGLVVLMLGLNLRQGLAPVAFLGLMGFALLTYKYFFVPELHARSLPLTLATHSPLTALSLLYTLAVFLDDQHLGWSQAPGLALWGIPMFWLLVIAWETSRKIRVPEEEDGYQTYSAVFGARGAAVLPVICLGVSFALAQFFAAQLGWSWVLRGGLILCFLYALGGFVRWWWRPTPAHAKLLPFVELYSLAFNVGLMVEFGVRLGLHWRP